MNQKGFAFALVIPIVVILAIGATAIIWYTVKSPKPAEPISQEPLPSLQSPQKEQPSSPPKKTKTTTSAPKTPVGQTAAPSAIIPVSIPSAVQKNCIGFLTTVPEETENIKLIGAGWTRPHPGPFAWGNIERTQGTYDFSNVDNYVQKTQQNNVAILATIWPFADWDQNSNPYCKVSQNDQFYPKYSGDQFSIPAYRCKPNNTEAYKKFVTALVDRYDGNGSNDMPGLKISIKYWEILNEPELNSPDLKFFIGNDRDYLEILKMSYETIKKQCADCKVLHAGAAGIQESFLSFWDKILTAGGANYFDIANIHHIGTGDIATLNVKRFKALLDKFGLIKPIWVTEAQFPDASADVKSSTYGALNAGAEKIFFVSFKVGGISPPVPGQYAPVYKEAVSLCK